MAPAQIRMTGFAVSATSSRVGMPKAKEALVAFL